MSDSGEDNNDTNGGGEGGNGNGGGGSDECPERFLETAPFDPRFPNQNQTKHCYVSFLDYHRCVKLRGEDYKPCEYFKRVFRSMCPKSWVEHWNDQMENGTFPAKI